MARYSDKEPQPQREEKLAWLGTPLAIVLALLAIVIVVWSIIQQVETADQPAETTPGAGGVEYILADHFVQDQFILRGPADAVDSAISLLGIEGVRRTNRNSYAQLFTDRFCPGLSDTPEQFRELVVDLYSFTPTRDTTVASIIREIEDGSAGRVDADFNWVNGSPWEIEGGPWEIEGGPWEIEGGQFENQEEAAANAFRNQWAWKTIGLDSPAYLMDAELETPRVRVGVFDTSPFKVSEDTPTQVNVPWVDEPAAMSLDVLHPKPIATPDPAEPGRVQNHGLFVAGLIYAVAPNSDIELIRVLEDNNKGNLYTLIEQALSFIEDVNTDESNPAAVMNLSLGLRLLPADAEGFEDLSRQVETLRDLFALARCSDIVVVAASGNDSGKLRIPLRANSPADWSSVIGVSASSQANERSCFSNQGDITAPGGDGLRAKGRTPACEPRIAECSGQDNCPYAVIGPVYKETGQEASGYGYWAGTSFAAPMVTGLAARVLEESEGDLSPADVRAIIECGATRIGDANLGAGIIHVQRTLDECIPLPEATLAE